MRRRTQWCTQRRTQRQRSGKRGYKEALMGDRVKLTSMAKAAG